MAEPFFNNRPSFRNLINKDKIIGVEIGVDSGENAKRILTNLDIRLLYLIDPWCGYSDLDGHGVIGDNEIAETCYQGTIKLLENFSHKIQIIRDYSEKAVTMFDDESLDFVYVDGNHRYEWVLQDITLYWPKVKMGGFLMGHDFKISEGVPRAVNEFFKNGFSQDNWDWWRQKDGKAP